MKRPLFLCGAFLPCFLLAQPDTLWVPTNGSTVPYVVSYEPVRNDPQYTRIGKFAFDTSRVAVELDYKRGHPSGVLRAYYPDGRPMIFAVYGWKTLHGDWAEYDEVGAITLKGKYKHGKRNGKWALKKEATIGRYKKGLKHGKWSYSENGRVVRTEKYRKGLLKRTRTFDTN
ncbi:MAG: hypothetical protein JNL43_06870 [Flavobacteriales bacterium]|nr:hypothetical protein [Flavobacteriales bacterium]HRH70495.1 hypothetical protein [Flavobacteriales bacterium]